MSRFLTCLVVIALAAAPAVACINDSELQSHEREFRSQYGKPAPVAAPPANPPSSSPSSGTIAGGAGVLLLLGATVVAWRGSTNRA
ncbi:hypothetical protein [Fimbriiglobus ruber]|uniref:Uncharacterized protein n=1 Tax=Fimbriiglobus ruber TaxID=1908690 RepID=A0A225E4N7_9BACT|nr:hypothetical protein [Fimbriiglobus ruber]OWK45046.1 hypothetical protein FRUB_01377 [Fimbriiglobus ruber]